MVTFHIKPINEGNSCHNEFAGVVQNPPEAWRNEYATDW